MSFRAVNRRGQPDFDPGLQRHHLLPRAVLVRKSFVRMFAAIGPERRRFEDFRDNGLLLPCREEAALRMGLPLHRGPHHGYTQLVVERVGQIEADWCTADRRDPRGAAMAAQMRLDLLRKALRRLLLTPSARRPLLNRRDPLGQGIDFAELDAMAELLWQGTDGAVSAAPATVMPPGAAFLPPFPQSMPVRPRRLATADRYSASSAATRSATDSIRSTAPTP
ncbi:hypothetical protein DM450_08170 [Sphingomonas sp. IC081]|nr:hypothetical protein DM450_08170 [Sphingomonas sp. IC081]QSR18358.1 hypothetical protein CA833_14375 [Novosphingobium sp. KA1]